MSDKIKELYINHYISESRTIKMDLERFERLERLGWFFYRSTEYATENTKRTASSTEQYAAVVVLCLMK